MATARRPRGPAIPPLLKGMNERTVLEAIRAGAPISRARDLAARRDLEAHGVARTAVAPRLGARPRGGHTIPDGPSYGAVFFEPVPDAALVLGLDLGARFVRGAVCDLAGDVRARQDVELAGSGAEAALDAIAVLAGALLSTPPGSRRELIDSAVVGVPGVVDADAAGST